MRNDRFENFNRQRDIAWKSCGVVMITVEGANDSPGFENQGHRRVCEEIVVVDVEQYLVSQSKQT